MEAAHTEETLHASALLGIHELLSGTTCVLDMGTVRHTEAIFDAVRSSGIRASVGKCLMDHPARPRRQLARPTRDALAEANCAFDPTWHGSRTRPHPCVVRAPLRDLLHRALLTEVARPRPRAEGAHPYARQRESQRDPAWSKSSSAAKTSNISTSSGLTSPELVLAHCVWLKPNEKNILKRTGTHVVHCPSSNMKLASRPRPCPELRARGINVALGADGAPCNNNLDMFDEMRLAALLHKPGAGPEAMRAQEVFDMATREGAHSALGWWDDIGSIEVGKKADLVALDLRTLPIRCRPARSGLRSGRFVRRLFDPVRARALSRGGRTSFYTKTAGSRTDFRALADEAGARRPTADSKRASVDPWRRSAPSWRIIS